MIDWIKAEFAYKVRVIMKDGVILNGSGQGISLAEDSYNDDEQFDTYYMYTNDGKALALNIDEIKEVIVLQMIK